MKGCPHDGTLMEDECDCAKPITVSEGLALMRAWIRHVGADDFTTVIVGSEFAAGYKAALQDGDPQLLRIVEAMAEAPLTKWSALWISEAQAVLAKRKAGESTQS